MGTTASYSEAEPGETYTVWSGGIGAGALIALFGVLRFGKFLWEATTDRQGMAPKFLTRSIVYACSYVAAADGEVRDDELSAIGFIIERVTGQAPPWAELRDIVSRWSESGFGSSDNFSGRLFLLDEGQKSLVLRCALLTANAGGPEGEWETARLEELARQLKAPRGMLDDLRAEMGDAPPSEPQRPRYSKREDGLGPSPAMRKAVAGRSPRSKK